MTTDQRNNIACGCTASGDEDCNGQCTPFLVDGEHDDNCWGQCLREKTCSECGHEKET